MSMYQEVILDHYRHPRHATLSQMFNGESHLVNPTCGDEMTLRVMVDEEVISDVSFKATGCAISVASASAMAELVEGAKVSQTAVAYAAFREMFLSRSEGEQELLGDCVAFGNLVAYPARVNCALLCWRALHEAIGAAAV